MVPIYLQHLLGKTPVELPHFTSTGFLTSNAWRVSMTITQGFHRKKFCFVSWSIAVWEEKGREKVKMETGLYWWNYCQVKTLSPIFFHAFIPTINPKIAFASTA